MSAPPAKRIKLQEHDQLLHAPVAKETGRETKRSSKSLKNKDKSKDKKPKSKAKSKSSSSSSSSSSSASSSSSSNSSESDQIETEDQKDVGSSSSSSSSDSSSTSSSSSDSSDNEATDSKPKKASSKQKDKKVSQPAQPSSQPAWMSTATLISPSATATLDEFAASTKLNKQLVSNLKASSISEFFPVQVAVIPAVLDGTVSGGDLLVCAPTGSGKTLTYVIPIVHSLMGRFVKRVRALVLVPTRELATQVMAEFQKLVKGTGLVVESLYGDKLFSEEQKRIVKPSQGHHLNEGASLVDIIVATPGRLVEHLQETEGFTLQHLRFLVVDEADRLLMQSYHDWLSKVLNAIHTNPKGGVSRAENGEVEIDVCTRRETQPFSARQLKQLPLPPLQKLLFSATLTQNPKKIASLKLINPKFFTSVTTQDKQYRIPESVKQNLVVSREDIKPLVLMTLLVDFRKANETQILIFTSSLETTHRLAVLLSILAESLQEKVSIVEYSSQLTQPERDRLIVDFKSGQETSVIVCSDVMSRGLDIQDIGVVINYDTPQFVKTYVHRVGRTGRAGREGKAYTLARKEEVHHFKKMLEKAENSKQKQVRVDYEKLKPLETRYQQALKILKLRLEREAKVSTNAPQPASTSEAMLANTPLSSQSEADVSATKAILKAQAAVNWFTLAKQSRAKDSSSSNSDTSDSSSSSSSDDSDRDDSTSSSNSEASESSSSS